ncbi:hypothetical protein Tco_0870385 [Tanacetum coccineum]
MSSITAQQAKLDLELVPKEKRLRLGNATEDSILERSKESPHFKLFWMLWLSLYVTLQFSSQQMFQVYSNQLMGFCYNMTLVHGQDFDALPTDKEIVSFLRDLGHIREIHSLNDVGVDQINNLAERCSSH